MDHEKITQTIRKMIADRQAHSAAERQKIYAAARAALEKTASADTTAMMELEGAILAVESGYAPEPQTPPPAAAPRNAFLRRLAEVAVSALVGALVAGLAIAVFIPQFLSQGTTANALKKQYEKTAPHVPAAIEFLQKASDAILKLQKSDPAGIEAKASKRFVALRTVDPQLDKQMPASLPPNTSIIIRADRNDFKLLFNWTLCGAVKLLKPEMVDPVRDNPDALGCPYFGLWSAGAAKW
jgi:hypothetical protein